MENLKKGDIIADKGDVREEIMGRLDDIVFTRRVFPTGGVGPLQSGQLIEDLVTYGFMKEEPVVKPIPGTLVGHLNETDERVLLLMAVKINELVQEVNKLQALVDAKK